MTLQDVQCKGGFLFIRINIGTEHSPKTEQKVLDFVEGIDSSISAAIINDTLFITLPEPGEEKASKLCAALMEQDCL